MVLAAAQGWSMGPDSNRRGWVCNPVRGLFATHTWRKVQGFDGGRRETRTHIKKGLKLPRIPIPPAAQGITFGVLNGWSHQHELHARPFAYEATALLSELWRRWVFVFSWRANYSNNPLAVVYRLQDFEDGAPDGEGAGFCVALASGQRQYSMLSPGKVHAPMIFPYRLCAGAAQPLDTL